MTVTLSMFAGAGAQFFDNNGNPLTGGKIYTYNAGTTTPYATYTTANGQTAHSNPIILDAAGRVPSSGEIWLSAGIGYKFVLQTSTGVTIQTLDNIPSSAQPPALNNASSIMYQQGYIATAGNFVVGETYQIETLGDTNFTLIGASVNEVGIYFIATGVGAGTGTAKLTKTVQQKLQESVSVKDFGAIGDGVANDTAAVQAALDSGAMSIEISAGTYVVTGLIASSSVRIYGDGTLKWKSSATDSLISLEASNIEFYGISFDGNAANVTPTSVPMIGFDTAPYSVFNGCTFHNVYYAVIITDVFNSPCGSVRDCVFTDIAQTIVSSGYTIAPKSGRWSIIGNQFYNIGNSHGVRIGLFNSEFSIGYEVRGTRVIGNEFRDIASGGGVIMELYAQDTVILGNTVLNCEQSFKEEGGNDPGNVGYGCTTRNNVMGLNTIRGTTNPVGVNSSGLRSIFGLNAVEDCAGGVTMGTQGVVIGNIFNNCGDLVATASTINMYSTDNMGIVALNMLVDSPYRAMNLNADNTIVTSNIISNPADRAISFSSGTVVKVHNNIVDGGTYGIVANSSTHNVELSGNHISNASTDNYSIADQTTAIIDSTNYNYTGYLFDLTLASGVVTSPIRQNAQLKIDTEGAAASDDLVTITPGTGGGYIGQCVSLKCASSARVITAKDGTGNLRLAGDFTFNSTTDRLVLEYDGANWVELSRSDN